MAKVLSFTPFYAGAGHNGGAETTLHDIMRMLRLDKHKTMALASRPDPDGIGSYVLDGVLVQGFSSKKDPDFYIPENDVILSHLGDAARTGILGKKYGKPVIHLIHNDQPYCVTAAERYSDALILNTAWVADAYSNCFDRPYTVLHPIVDPRRYSVETNQRYITIINLTVGQTDRLSYDKGARTFYELAERFPDEEFLAVKGGYGDQYIPTDLPKNVTVMEHTNNILDVYRQTKVILAPSKYESYGRVPLEAACSGIPSVVTNLPGTQEAMGYASAFCEFGNIPEWEWALTNVLNNYDDYSWMAARRVALTWRRTLTEWDHFRNMFKVLVEGW